MWVVDPDIVDCPCGDRTDEYGRTQIAYISPDIGRPQTSDHDVAVSIKALVGGYCQRMIEEEWNWGIFLKTPCQREESDSSCLDLTASHTGRITHIIAFGEHIEEVSFYPKRGSRR